MRSAVETQLGQTASGDVVRLLGGTRVTWRPVRHAATSYETCVHDYGVAAAEELKKIGTDCFAMPHPAAAGYIVLSRANAGADCRIVRGHGRCGVDSRASNSTL